MAQIPCKPNVTIFVFVFVALATNLIDCDTTQELIDRVCKAVNDAVHDGAVFCNIVFNDNIKSPGTNTRGLAEIALNQGIECATNSAPYAKELSYKATDPRVQQYYQSCAVTGYFFTLEGLNKGLQSWKDSKYQEMVNNLSTVPNTQRLSCEDYKPPSLVDNPLEARNREMKIVIAMAVATAAELNRGTPVAGKY